MINTFLREKPVKILLYIQNNKESITHHLARDIRMTYTHAINLIYRFEEKGFISREKKGRRQILSLTKKGKLIAEKLQLVYNLLGREEDGK